MNGNELKQARERLGLSQEALGEWLEVSRNTISRWERDELSIQHPKMLHLAMRAIEIGLLQNDEELIALQNEVMEKMKKLDAVKIGRPPEIGRCVKCGEKAIERRGQFDKTELSEEEIKAAEEMDRREGFTGIREDPKKNYVICSNLKCREYSGMYPTREEAINIWNTIVNKL